MFLGGGSARDQDNPLPTGLLWLGLRCRPRFGPPTSRAGERLRSGKLQSVMTIGSGRGLVSQADRDPPTALGLGRSPGLRSRRNRTSAPRGFHPPARSDSPAETGTLCQTVAQTSPNLSNLGLTIQNVCTVDISLPQFLTLTFGPSSKIPLAISHRSPRLSWSSHT
jgi:hypothetical protein